MAQSKFEFLKRAFLYVWVTSLAFGGAPEAIAVSNLIETEAESKLKFIDCQLLSASDDIERLGRGIEKIHREISSGGAPLSTAPLAKASRLIKYIAASMTEEGLVLTSDELKSLEISGGIAVHASPTDLLRKRVRSWRASFRSAYQILTASYSVSGPANQKARDIIQNLNNYQGQIETATDALEMLLDNRGDIERVLALNETNSGIRYFGRLCTGRQFDGVWQTEDLESNRSEPKDVLEIRGDAFHLDSGVANVTEACGLFEGRLDYNKSGGATGWVQEACDDLNVVMGLYITKVDDRLMVLMCQSFSSEAPLCQLDMNAHPTSFVRTSD